MMKQKRLIFLFRSLVIIQIICGLVDFSIDMWGYPENNTLSEIWGFLAFIFSAFIFVISIGLYDSTNAEIERSRVLYLVAIILGFLFLLGFDSAHQRLVRNNVSDIIETIDGLSIGATIVLLFRRELPEAYALQADGRRASKFQFSSILLGGIQVVACIIFGLMFLMWFIPKVQGLLSIAGK